MRHRGGIQMTDSYPSAEETLNALRQRLDQWPGFTDQVETFRKLSSAEQAELLFLMVNELAARFHEANGEPPPAKRH